MTASRAVGVTHPGQVLAELTAGAVAGPGRGVAAFRARFPLLAQLVRYSVVGGLGTAVNALLYLLVRLVLDAVPANLVALLLSTAVSTEINRRFTFQGASAHRWRVYVQDAGTVAFYAGYSTAVLLVLHEIVPGATPLEETAAVTLASVLGGLIRFAVLKAWVFETRSGDTGPAADGDRPGYGPDHGGHDGVHVLRRHGRRGQDPRDAWRRGPSGAPAPRLPAESRDVAAGDARAGRAAHGRRDRPPRVRGVRPSALR
ncbi:GtrA family protein [Pseudonocardia halophobica]|uniref:GtrA family protein n=1 Tax=Pseudonocardia halophobica TaxID=29401 RepID=UPI003D8F932A